VEQTEAGAGILLNRPATLLQNAPVLARLKESSGFSAAQSDSKVVALIWEQVGQVHHGMNALPLGQGNAY
jgi:hypothetical protein